MTRFVDVSTMSRLVQEIGLPQLIGELADCIQSDFIHWPEFDKCARVANHSEIGVIELMPVSNAKNYAFKYVNGHPNNTRQGLYTVMAFGVLAEVETGYPVLLSELTLATALRTCATSLMAARALARPDARRMALIGNGAQSEFQALAFHYHLGIEEIAVYDIDPLATEKLVRNLSAWPSLRIVCARSTAEAVRGADIVTTDVWTSMGFEAENAERLRDFADWQVDAEMMRVARPDALFLHCLPAHRGEEVSAEVIDGPKSVVWDEAENRLHVQKALMEYLVLGRVKV